MTPSFNYGSTAKITSPRISGVFPRTRLFRLLDAYLEYPAVWISASAGSGKTTLAASYIKERGLPSIWYQIDPGDGDIATFFYYMGRVAKKAAPESPALPLLTHEYLQGISTFTSRYFDEFFRRIHAPCLITFDNYHLIPDNSPLHQIILTFINMIPDSIHLLFISRQDPPAQFARLRANEQLRMMAAGDIRFTLDESLNMAHKKGFHHLPKKAIHKLYEKTEGWAAGLVLMLERLRMEGFEAIESPELAAENVFEYFTCEVFEKTDPTIREFLLKTAFLPRMTVDMVKSMTGIKISGKILNSLYRNHFFIQKDTQFNPYYQYHPLFRDFLQAKASHQMTSAQVLATIRKSVRILEKADQVEDAVVLLFIVQDWKNLTRILHSYAPVIIRQGRHDTLKNWFAAFPKAILEQFPWLLYWFGICGMNKAPRESFIIFERVFKLFDDRNDLPGKLLAWSGAVDCLILIWGDYALLDPWVAWMDSFIEKGGRFTSREVAARCAANMVAALIWRFPYRKDVEVWLEQASSLSREVGDTELEFQNQFNRVNYYYFLGDFNRLDLVIQAMSEISSDANALPLSQLYLKVAKALTRTILSYGDPGALELVTEAIKMSEQTGIFIFNNILYVLGFFAAMNIGNIDISDEYLDRKACGLRKGTRDDAGTYYLCLAWRRLMKKDFAMARSAADQGFKIAMEGGGMNSCQIMHHLLAIILQEQRQYDEALRHLSSVRKLIQVSDEGYYYNYLCYLTEADIYLDIGVKKKALKCLKNAFTIGRKHGYKSLYLFWRPAAMARLCAEALTHGIEVEHIRGLVAALGLSGDCVAAHLENWPWPVKIYTLGKFEIFKNDVRTTFIGKAPKKPLQLLMALIALGGKNVKNERLKDRLWPDAEGDKAQSAFTSTLSRLRGLIGNNKAIVVHDGMISLNPNLCWIDVWAFERLADLIEEKTRSGESTNLIENALNMYHGSFLSEEDDQPWIPSLREHLFKRYRRLVLSKGDLLEKAKKWGSAADCYRRVLKVENTLDEILHQRLMVCYFQMEQPQMAVRVYEKFAKDFESKLGKKPPRSIEIIYQKLKK